MILSTAKRLFFLATFAFATMGFLAVPLADKTGFEHVRDFVQSDEAQAAGDKIEESFDSLEASWQEAEKKRAREQEDARGEISDEDPATQVIRRR